MEQKYLRFILVYIRGIYLFNSLWTATVTMVVLCSTSPLLRGVHQETDLDSMDKILIKNMLMIFEENDSVFIS